MEKAGKKDSKKINSYIGKSCMLICSFFHLMDILILFNELIEQTFGLW